MSILSRENPFYGVAGLIPEVKLKRCTKTKRLGTAKEESRSSSVVGIGIPNAMDLCHNIGRK